MLERMELRLLAEQGQSSDLEHRFLSMLLIPLMRDICLLRIGTHSMENRAQSRLPLPDRAVRLHSSEVRSISRITQGPHTRRAIPSPWLAQTSHWSMIQRAEPANIMGSTLAARSDITRFPLAGPLAALTQMFNLTTPEHSAETEITPRTDRATPRRPEICRPMLLFQLMQQRLHRVGPPL